MPRLSLLCLVTVILTGCATDSTNTPRETTRQQPRQAIDTKSVFDLIRAAELAEAGEANRLRLRAAELALAAGDINQVKNILSTLALPVAAPLEQQYALTQAKVAMAEGKGLEALDWLRKPALARANLNQAQQVELSQMRAQAYYLARSYLASARERMFLNPLLTGEEKLTNQEAIFSSLLELPAENLNEQASKAITSELRGWLSLAAMTKQYQSNPMRQLEGPSMHLLYL